MIIIKNKATKGVFTKSKLTNVKGGRASYKSDDEYLRAVYNKNRKRFEGNDAFKDPLRTPYQLFKLNINDLTQNYGVSDVEEAVRIMGRREYFYESKEARFTAQSYVDIRADKKFFKHLRKLYQEKTVNRKNKYITQKLIDYDPVNKIFNLYYIDKQGRRVYSDISYKQEYQDETHEWVWTIL